MKKIPSVFMRNYDGNRLVRDEVVPESKWALTNERAIPTIKYDGTACMWHGLLYKRHDLKKGRKRPKVWLPCQPKPDEKTGHWPGWVPVGSGPEDKYHIEAERNFYDRRVETFSPGQTYELVGPKVQGNPYDLDKHYLIKHGNDPILDLPAFPSFNQIYTYLCYREIEGIVWHHPDGIMAKIKAKDFGIKWPR